MKMLWKTLLWVFLIIIVVYAMYMAYKDVSVNLVTKESNAESFEEPRLKICLIYAMWCPHCEKYLESNTFMSTYTEIKKQPKYEKVSFEQIDYEKNKKLVEGYNVSGFPSIIAVHTNGKLLEVFKGDRFNKKDLIKFVDQNIGKL